MSETDQTPAPTPSGGGGDISKVVVVYVLFLAGFVTGITALIALILAYVFKDEASQVEISHYNNIINVFWKGLVYSIVCALLLVVVIGAFLYIALAVWVIVRCAKGLNFYSKGKPYPDPGSWGF